MTSMGDAMMNRPLIARLETVLRHRRRNTCKQRSKKRDNLQGGHLHALLSIFGEQLGRRMPAGLIMTSLCSAPQKLFYSTPNRIEGGEANS